MSALGGKADMTSLTGTMFRSCDFFVPLAKMRFGTERMRQALRRILVFVLAAGLAASAPALSHAQSGHSGAAASHENYGVQHYADLAIEPGDDGCPHDASGPAHDQNNELCKKCCVTCLGASLIPIAPVAVPLSSDPGRLVARFDHKLVARDIPTEPEIPKPL
jgi:hypothetical protein